MTQTIQITDVTLRDGLQAESKTLSTEEKLKLFEKLTKCPFQRLEVSSFVHPKWVPQLADGDAFCRELFATKLSIETMAFVPNAKGLDRLLAFPITWVSAFVAATETFNQKNINASIDATLENLKEVAKRAHAEKRKLRVYLSTVFGCPYDRDVSNEQLEKVFGKVAECFPDEVALSDTIGVASPKRVQEVVRLASKFFPVEKLALHLHNTYGLALANIWAGYEVGITKFDGSTGGIGGCPYAKGASGNVPSEEILYLFYRAGVVPEISWDRIAEVLEFLKQDLGLAVRSKLNDIREKGGVLYGI